MELILSALFGAGVTIVVFWSQALRLWRELDFLRDSSDFWRKSALQLEDAAKNAVGGWGKSIDDSIAWAALVRDIKDDHQTLRDRLAAALWELRRVKRAKRLDDQVTWRLGEIERKMATWEGD